MRPRAQQILLHQLHMPRLRSFKLLIRSPQAPRLGALVVERLSVLRGAVCSPESIEIDAPTTPFDITSGQDAFDELKHLSVTIGAEASVTSALNFISRIRSLQSLHWSSTHFIDPEDLFITASLNSNSLKLPKITIYGDNGANFITHMQLSQLRHLVILISEAVALPIAEDVLQCLRGYPALRTLRLPPEWWSGGGWRHMLRTQAELRALGSRASETVNDTLEWLSEPEDLAPWVPQAPHLSTFYLGDVPASTLEDLIARPANMRPGTGMARIPSPVPQPPPIYRSIRYLLQSRTVEYPAAKGPKILLNQSLWGDPSRIPESYSDLALDFPDNVQLLDYDNDEIPGLFLPHWRSLLSSQVTIKVD